MLSMKQRLANMDRLMKRNDERFQALNVKRNSNPEVRYYIVEACRGKPDLGNGRYERYNDLGRAHGAASYEWRNREKTGAHWDHVTIYRCKGDLSDAVCWADGVAIGNGL